MIECPSHGKGKVLLRCLAGIAQLLSINHYPTTLAGAKSYRDNTTLLGKTTPGEGGFAIYKDPPPMHQLPST